MCTDTNKRSRTQTNCPACDHKANMWRHPILPGPTEAPKVSLHSRERRNASHSSRQQLQDACENRQQRVCVCEPVTCRSRGCRAHLRAWVWPVACRMWRRAGITFSFYTEVGPISFDFIQFKLLHRLWYLMPVVRAHYVLAMHIPQWLLETENYASSKLCSQTVAPDGHIGIYRGPFSGCKVSHLGIEKHSSNNIAGCVMITSVHIFLVLW